MQIYISIFIWIIMGISTAYVAKQRGRDPIIWFVVGLLLGIIGLIVVFILPVVSEEELDLSDRNTPTITITPIIENGLPSGYLFNQWFYLNEEREQKGPFTFEELREKWHDGIITDESYVWSEEMPKWVTLKELKLFKTPQG